MEIGEYKTALSSLVHASSSNIFYYRKEYKLTFLCSILIVGYLTNDAQAIGKIIRVFLFLFPTSPLFLYISSYFLLSLGLFSHDLIAKASNLKFFLRTEKRLSSGQDTYSHSIHNDSLIIALFCAHSYLASKSYGDALIYYGKCLELAPDDPLILLCIGVIYLLKCIQRVSPNPQFQFLQVKSVVL